MNREYELLRPADGMKEDSLVITRPRRVDTDRICDVPSRPLAQIMFGP